MSNLLEKTDEKSNVIDSRNLKHLFRRSDIIKSERHGIPASSLCGFTQILNLRVTTPKEVVNPCQPCVDLYILLKDLRST